MVLYSFSYKNGSLTRERIRDSCANGCWKIFSELIDSTPRGNFGNIGFYFDHPEIVPDGVQGDIRFNRNDEPASRFASNETEVRALVESQMVAKRIHAERMGFTVTSDTTRILVTGGASVNTVILQVIADVFNAKVYTMVRAKINFNSDLSLFCVIAGSSKFSSTWRSIQSPILLPEAWRHGAGS